MDIAKSLPTRYNVIEKLGEGGTGQVYKVHDQVLDNTLALKVLLKTSKNSYLSLQEEFKLLTQLNHPNLIKVHDFGLTKNNVPFFTMDYVEGKDLESFFNPGLEDLQGEGTADKLPSFPKAAQDAEAHGLGS